MPRKGQVARRDAVSDPKFDSVLVTRFVSSTMKRGKRSIAERAFYGAMAMVEQKSGQDAMTVIGAVDGMSASQVRAFFREVGAFDHLILAVSGGAVGKHQQHETDRPGGAGVQRGARGPASEPVRADQSGVASNGGEPVEPGDGPVLSSAAAIGAFGDPRGDPGH